MGELLREEQHLATQLSLTQDSVTTAMVNVAYDAQAKGRLNSQIQCYSCKEFGHIAKHWTKKFCNYCKKEGHIIKDCHIQPQNKQSPSVHSNLGAVHPATIQSQPPTTGSSSTLTPEMVQQMIVSAFSAFRLQGKRQLLNSPWLTLRPKSLTGSTDALHDVRMYKGNQYIQIANSSTLLLPLDLWGPLLTMSLCHQNYLQI